MAFTGDVESERKFEVDEMTQLPPLPELPGVDRVEQPIEHQFDALYFDTDDLVLAARRMTLRRRTGGDDAGWHLKVPVSFDERREIREPLGEDPNNVPPPLLHLVRMYIRDRGLVPVARLRVRRTVYRLRDVHGGVLADFCDDRVQAERLGTEPQNLNWREWEIELADGPPALLNAAQSMLATADIHAAAYASKLARALGDRYPQEVPSPPPRPERNHAAANVLLTYVHAQVQALTGQDFRVRQDAPDSVHLMRIAVRRLRSALTTYRTLLDIDLVDHLSEELKWLASVLGAQRDAEVMRQHLKNLIAAEPSELVVGPVARRIDEHLEAGFRTARQTALEALDGERYFRLLDNLAALLAAPPVTELASDSEHEVVPKLVRNEWQRLRRAVRAAERIPAGIDHDLALHKVRKNAKRLRYAAETATPLHGKRAVRLAAAAEGLQTILGDHHDSIVARDLLRHLAIAAHLQGEDGFTYGHLHALEQHAAQDAEIQFLHAWNHFPSTRLKR